jgi:hypothetical protein
MKGNLPKYLCRTRGSSLSVKSYSDMASHSEQAKATIEPLTRLLSTKTAISQSYAGRPGVQEESISSCTNIGGR